MKTSTPIVLLSLGSSVSAALGVVSSSKCWRKCARQVGISCGWNEVSCNCRAVNAGLYAAANQCYCNVCSDETSRVAVDWTSVQLKTFSVACSIIFEPLDQQAIEKAVDTASCESSGKDSSDNIYSFPDIYTLENETPPKMTPVPTSLNFDTTFVYGFSPTSSTGSSAIVVPIASTATRDVTYSYATLTVPVTPVPVSSTGSTSSNASQPKTSTTATPASTTGTKTAQQSKGAAMKQGAGSLDLGVSVFAFAVAIIFGL